MRKSGREIRAAIKSFASGGIFACDVPRKFATNNFSLKILPEGSLFSLFRNFVEFVGFGVSLRLGFLGLCDA